MTPFNYKNKWYRFSCDPKGNIHLFSTEGEEILAAIGYRATYGAVYNAHYPMTEGGASIILDQTAGLNVGDTVQIRNEFRRGYMNRPLVHEVQITDIVGDKVSFTPGISKSFCDQQIVSNKLSVFLVKNTDQINGLENFMIMDCQLTGSKIINSLKTRCETPKAIVTTRYEFSSQSPALNITVITKYKEPVKVFNESVILDFAVPVTQVYRKNRQIDTTNFQKEYWLDKQGAKFGRGGRSAFIYHTPDLSSMKLITTKNQLILNLDDMHDHRYGRDSYGFFYGKLDLRAFHQHHAAEFNPGEQRSNKYTLIVGESPKAIPRFMISPYGFLATQIWTEHADRSSLKSHRAVYYGREDITAPAEAVGGFVKHRTPVTKSIFFANPLHRYYKENFEPGGNGSEDPKSYRQVAIKDDPEFLRFLTDLYQLGYEICVHGLGPSSSDENQQLLEETVAFMKDHFNAVTWIDHGRHYTNISTDGLCPSSSLYARDLWEKYGIKYFWHYSTEDITHTHDYNIDLLQISKGDHLPTPLYWSHPTVTYGFYSWPTIAPSLKIYTEKSLNDLINNWSISINHVYPAWIYDETSEYYIQESDGKMAVNPLFENILKNMAHLRDEGELNLTTIRDALNYWIKLENIRFEYQDTNRIRVHNHNPEKIAGLSMAIHGLGISQIQVNGQKPSSKTVGSDIIFWFDMEPKSSVEIGFA